VKASVRLKRNDKEKDKEEPPAERDSRSRLRFWRSENGDQEGDK